MFGLYDSRVCACVYSLVSKKPGGGGHLLLPFTWPRIVQMIDDAWTDASNQLPKQRWVKPTLDVFLTNHAFPM